MRIAQKLICGFVSVALLVGVVGTISILQNKNSQDIVEEEVYRSISHLGDVWELMEAQEHQEIAANNYLFLDESLKERRADYFHEKERLEKVYQRYSRQACEHVKPLIEKYYDNIKIYHTKIEETFELHRQGADLELIKERLREANKYVEIAHEDALEPIIEHVYKKHIEPAKEDIAKEISRITSVTILISVIAVFLAIGLGLFVSHSIYVPLTKLRAAAAEMGEGKLDTKIEIKTKDEIGKLAASFNDMAAKLKDSHFKLKESHKQLEEKVQERTAELSSSNATLKGEVEQRTSAQKTLEERIKELKCLFGLSKLIEQPGISLEQIFEETVDLIHNAYQDPDKTCVRITFEGVRYKTDNFKKSELSQYAPIEVHGEKAGAIEVYYLGEKPENGQSPFLKEEQDLLDVVAERLGKIAERKRAGEKLRLFRNLIDQSNDSVFVIEPKWGRFLDVNDRACASLGHTREELFEMGVKDIEEVIPDDSAWTEHVKEVRKKGYMVLEGRHKRKDGTTFPVEINIKFIEQEKDSYMLAVARDITERKQAEEKQAKLFEQVESINQELKDFAYIVSHDLKAPLRGIRTLADWIGSDYADKLDDEGREQMGLLSGRVDRMHNLIDGILEYSRVGREIEKRVQVNLNVLVSEVIEMVAPTENIEITVENEMPVVECGKTRIMQVFQNLLSNAVKYTDKPQGRIKIGCVEEDGFWKFSVADNGPGIEERHFEKIFQIFQTLSPRDEVESTGVGLSVVKKIVELYGGKIWVESKPGEGSTFFFTLPKPESEVANDAKLEAHIIGRR